MAVPRTAAALLHAASAAINTPEVQPAVVVNYVSGTHGRVRAVCCCCGKQSRAVKPDDSGEPDLWRMARRWSQAPFPADCRHHDGSVGSTYTCPECNRQLRRGATLQRRAYLISAEASA